MVYYNEYDPHAAAWLRELIRHNLIAPGHVDGRSILDVTPDDLKGYTQCHFFAGVGVWSYALRRAGWRDDQPVWTGSPPCQGFSAAGKGKGFEDERHLWPVLFHLIRECRPAVFFGEQVEAAIRFGWLDLVQADMEGIDYAFGAAGLPAAGFGAPHIRARLYFLGETDRALHGLPEPVELGHAVGSGLEGHGGDGDHGDQSGRDGAVESGSAATAGPVVQLADANGGQCGGESDGQGCQPDWPTTGWLESHRKSQRRGAGGGLAYTDDSGSQGRLVRGNGAGECAAGPGGLGGGLAEPGSFGRERREGAAQGSLDDRSDAGRLEGHDGTVRSREAGPIGMADASREQHDGGGLGGPGRRTEHSDRSTDSGMGDTASAGSLPGSLGRVYRGQEGAGSWDAEPQRPSPDGEGRPGPTNGFWAAADWLFCRDGKWRPVVPCIEPLADGAPAGVVPSGTDSLGFNYRTEDGYALFSPLEVKGRARVMRLKGYGNAICSEVAQGFIESYLEARAERDCELKVAA